MDELFARGGFQLHKWNTSEPDVLKHVKPEYRDVDTSHQISDAKESTKTLGLEWETRSDQFHLTICQAPTHDNLTKRMLISDLASVFDALGWYSPAVKILLQRLWEQGLSWYAPSQIQDVWHRWRLELPCLLDRPIPRRYYPKDSNIVAGELHGFSDASEEAYAAVIYLRLTDSNGLIHTSLVMSKAKVAPIKRLSIPRLELCGALLLSNSLTRVKDVLNVPMNEIVAWTDSTVVLSWLAGNPRRFKTYVGNRVAELNFL